LARLYLARLRSNDGALDRLVVVKVLGDGRLRPPSDPNPVQVRLFQGEYRALRLFREGDVDPVVRLSPFDLKTGGGVELPRHLPLFFCDRRKVFFTPRCARCAGPLRDCQDDALLERFGLRPYSASNARYLHCPACAGEVSGGGLRFYSHAPDQRELGSGAVGDHRALVGSFGELARRGPAGIPDFPCAECAHVGACHPAGGDGEAHLLIDAFSFHDFYAFVHEFLPLRFDEACDLLGGRPPDAVLSGPEWAQAAVPSFGLYYEGDPGGRGALELLLAKLGLCRELCVGVRAIHDRFEAPHLHLRPEFVWVGVGGPNLVLPGPWDLRLRVTPPDYPVRAGGPAESRGPKEAVYRLPEAEASAYVPPQHPEAPAGFGHDLFAAGLLVLRALLGNRVLGEERLAEAVRRARWGEAGGEPLPQALIDRANLWWEPRPAAGQAVPSRLWKRALGAASDLVSAVSAEDPRGVLSQVIRSLTDLESEVRAALLLDQPGRGLELREVLAELIQDEAWLAAVEGGRPPGGVEKPEPRPAAPQAPEPRFHDEMEATVIVRPGASPRPRPAAPAAAPPSEPGAADDFEETIILPASARQAKGRGER
jgi:hypothetical protein